MTGPGRAPRLDYDRIAHLYDERVRDHGVDPELEDWLANRPAHAGGVLHALDIGCGTGKQMAVHRQRFPDAVLVGVDRSMAMLGIAHARCPSACLVRGDGACLPLKDAAFDYASSQFSYQHVRRTPDLLGEAFRVLRPGGRFVMTNIDPWAMPGWMIYRFLPEAVALDREDFLPLEQFADTMRAAGFQAVRLRRVDLGREQTLGGCLEFLAGRHRASQLMAASDAAYATCLERVRDEIARRGKEAVFRSDFVLASVAGDKPV